MAFFIGFTSIYPQGDKSLADTGNYPGRDEIAQGLALINPPLGDKESTKFIERFNVLKNGIAVLRVLHWAVSSNRYCSASLLPWMKSVRAWGASDLSLARFITGEEHGKTLAAGRVVWRRAIRDAARDQVVSRSHRLWLPTGPSHAPARLSSTSRPLKR
ncbi:MAG: hypothetical protein NT069_33065 [Planctomycetota bacterium]|nr:hypothetical protein [Planctomycetota bacterium]